MRTLLSEEKECAMRIVETLIDSGLMATNKWIRDFLREDASPSIGNFDFAFGATKYVIIHDELPNWVIKFSDSPYCRVEYDNYVKAKSDGFAHYFPTTELLLVSGEWSFILSEKCYCDEDYVCDSATDVLMDSGDFDDREDAYDYVSNGDIEEEEMLNCMIGDPSFNSWIGYMGINDLHSGNFGKNQEGCWVIIDFSGYGLCFDEEEDE